MHIRIDMNIHTYGYKHTYIPTYIHISLHTYIHTHTSSTEARPGMWHIESLPTYIQTYIHSYKHECIHKYMQIYIHTFIIHTHANTHTHAHTSSTEVRPGIWHIESLQKTASNVLASKGSGFDASITCDMTSFICVTWLHSYVWHVSSVCVFASKGSGYDASIKSDMTSFIYAT